MCTNRQGKQGISRNSIGSDVKKSHEFGGNSPAGGRGPTKPAGGNTFASSHWKTRKPHPQISERRQLEEMMAVSPRPLSFVPQGKADPSIMRDV
jgi:hypothetical protein